MDINNFNEVSPFHWVLEKGTYKESHGQLKTGVEIFGTREILETALKDQSIQQVVNVSSLPGIISASLAMPDIHYGYGFCIGGVAAFPADGGIVLPGGVGYDINCGVRLISTHIPKQELDRVKESLGYTILNRIPTGLSNKGGISLNKDEFKKLLSGGAEEIVSHYGGSDRESLQFIESNGKLDFHMPEMISYRAIERGKSQVGSLGGGNHFIEIQAVDEIYDEEAAIAFGLEKGTLALMIHTGSRGFGHQIASDFIERFRKRNPGRIKATLPDPQLIFAEIDSKEGKQYLQGLNAASNFAWANRHLLMSNIIAIMEEIFSGSATSLGMHLVYDQAHNIAKFEEHEIQGRRQKVLVHRKGATRAFPPGHRDIPARYRHVGQPVLIPGSMGTASYVLKGTKKAMEISMGSSAHGAGRKLSRHQAIKFSADMNVKEYLKKSNILAYALSNKGLKEEIPQAYKEIDEVIAVTEGAGISEKVARLIPLIVIKG